MSTAVAARTTSAGRLRPARVHPGDSAGETNLEESLVRLEHLDIANMQMRWRQLFGKDAPARLGPELLKRAIAHRLQELALGGLSRQAHLRLKTMIQRPGRNGGSHDSASASPIIKPGTRFVREWQGQHHEVQAIDSGGFVYRGKAYRSLSVIAREITGAHQSGPRFFGIGPKDAKRSATGAICG